MEANVTPPKRKACDLCYRRKIKCDSQQPRCSTCQVYNCECTYKAASRKVPSRKQAALQRQHRECDLQSRVKTLENQLSTVLEKLERIEKVQGVSVSSSSSLPTPAHTADIGVAATAAGSPEGSSGLFDMPPYHHVLPVVERYLVTFNSVLPLFHPPSILQIVKNWYQNPHSRDPVTGAIINVVLALAHHTSSLGEKSPIGDTATFLHNAQSVLTDITMRETHLVNIQVLLGLVMLFWTADDLSPALILIGTALRLAHKIGLHVRKGSQHCSPAVALQRNRVFWIAYILDRDISLQSGLAPVQLDSDIDLDLPPLETEDDLTGFVFAPDGYTKMNYFRARVELARIQGKVYDSVYSASAQNLDFEERRRRNSEIFHMLDDWSSRIPPEFHALTLSQSGPSSLSKFFCILYSTRLSCRALASFASPFDSFHYSEWMRRLQEYGGKVAAGHVGSHAPVPHGWPALADASREFMRLFQTVDMMDTFFTRMTLCAHNSSLISITASRIFDAHFPSVESDKEIMTAGMKNLEQMVDIVGSDNIRQLHGTLKRLCSYADSMSVQLPTCQDPAESFWDAEARTDFMEPSELYYQEGNALVSDINLNWPSILDEALDRA